jgi:hypothetical protein
MVRSGQCQLALQLGDPSSRREERQLDEVTVELGQCLGLRVCQTAFQSRRHQHPNPGILADSVIHAPPIQRDGAWRKSQF